MWLLGQQRKNFFQFFQKDGEICVWYTFVGEWASDWFCIRHGFDGLLINWTAKQQCWPFGGACWFSWYPPDPPHWLFHLLNPSLLLLQNLSLYMPLYLGLPQHPLYFSFFFWSPFSRSPAQNTRVSSRRVRESQPAGSPNPLLCARISSQISQGISSLGERRVANAKLERFVRDPCGRIYELESVSISQKLLHFFSYHTLLPPRFIQSMLLLSLCYIKLAGATDFTLLSI